MRRLSQPSLKTAGALAAAVLFAGLLDAADAPVLYPALPETPRLQFLKSFSSSKDVGEGDSWFARFIFGKRKESSLGKPYGLAVESGKIYLCDIMSRDVRILDLERRKMRWLAKPGRIKLKTPVNISISPDGYKYVADSGLDQVVVFGPDDRFVQGFSDTGGWKPTDAAAAGSNLYVVDIANDKVKVLDRAKGRVLFSFGQSGSGEGQFSKPTNIAVDEAGNVYVSDTINFRIQKFDAKGRFLKSVGQMGRTPGSFSRPRGLAVDRQGRLYAVDAAFENVQIFDAKGQPLLFFGGPGNGPGDMCLPAKVALDYDAANLKHFESLADPRITLKYLVWVTNQFGPNAVSVYGAGRWQDKK
ncbi:MAG: hypothetical protein HY747_03770 [Elusimicrobia bacterium]|nr:hypothetical protein [Elusimicrobiota bacterium]